MPTHIAKAFVSTEKYLSFGYGSQNYSIALDGFQDIISHELELCRIADLLYLTGKELIERTLQYKLHQ